ncbi:hypothetical protein KQX54_000809 [Cotesia glomerata]|uniref:Uncharacterized protein n=1 Tax=Cotesia glomerata TaxID=32391 RepID=A0AAV7ISJ9_COTGL|nr:hypothetical protein KQX54_000809 [Cotesia glomerata]
MMTPANFPALPKTKRLLHHQPQPLPAPSMTPAATQYNQITTETPIFSLSFVLTNEKVDPEGFTFPNKKKMKKGTQQSTDKINNNKDITTHETKSEGSMTRWKTEEEDENLPRKYKPIPIIIKAADINYT